MHLFSLLLILLDLLDTFPIHTIRSLGYILLILLDLLATFDIVNHHKLLMILSVKLGLQGTALKWFEHYFSGMVQSVLIDGIESDIWNILFGVPRESVLEPILYLIYSSLLGHILHCHGIMYCYAYLLM